MIDLTFLTWFLDDLQKVRGGPDFVLLSLAWTLGVTIL